MPLIGCFKFRPLIVTAISHYRNKKFCINLWFGATVLSLKDDTTGKCHAYQQWLLHCHLPACEAVLWKQRKCCSGIFCWVKNLHKELLLPPAVRRMIVRFEKTGDIIIQPGQKDGNRLLYMSLKRLPPVLLNNEWVTSLAIVVHVPNQCYGTWLFPIVQCGTYWEKCSTFTCTKFVIISSTCPSTGRSDWSLHWHFGHELKLMHGGWSWQVL